MMKSSNLIYGLGMIRGLRNGMIIPMFRRSEEWDRPEESNAISRRL